MLYALRSVMPRVAAMSRNRTPGSCAMHSNTRPWFVRKVHSAMTGTVSTFQEIRCRNGWTRIAGSCRQTGSEASSPFGDDVRVLQLGGHLLSMLKDSRINLLVL